MSGILGILLGSNSSAAVSTTTFDPANSGTNGTLSAGNLVWTATGATALTRSIANHSTGKYFFEVTLTTFDGTTYDAAVVIMNATQGLNALAGSVNSLEFYAGGDATVYSNNLSIGAVTGENYAQGAVIGVAIDMGASLVWFRSGAGNWNGSGTADPATGAGGFTYSVAGSLYAGVFTAASGNAWTANFGATAYAHAAPSGFGNL